MDPDLIIENFETGGLTLSHAELMVENCIGKVSLPLGLGLIKKYKYLNVLFLLD